MGIINNLFGKGKSTEKQNEKRQKENYSLRDKFWNNIGRTDPDVLAFLINPAFTGNPSWPDLRQAYKRIMTNDSMILATDGLSDEFSDSDEPNNGFEIEFFVEVTDDEYTHKTLDELKGTWIFELLYQTALNAADSGAFKNQYDRFGVFSFELYNVDVPQEFITEEGTVGVLIGMESKKVPSSCQLVSRQVNFLSITLLTLKELNYIIEVGQEGRKEIVNRLKESGINNISSIKRESVI